MNWTGQANFLLPAPGQPWIVVELQNLCGGSQAMLVLPWHSLSSMGQMMMSCSQLISLAPCHDLNPSLSHTDVCGEGVTLQHFSSLL